MKEDKLRSLQNQLDCYWKTTYVDKLRREELESQKRKQEHHRKLTELSSRIEAYQDKTMKQKKKTKRQQFIEHERRSGELLMRYVKSPSV